MTSLSNRIKDQARLLGFELAGIAPAGEADGFAHLEDWLAQGFAGEMEYMPRLAEARRHPDSILPTVRSVVMVGINYKPAASSRQPAPNTGSISCYAGGADYHGVLREKLKLLLAWIQREVPGTRGRVVVDTAPLLERDFARRAGLGWFGKNTMLLHKQLGSYFFLGALLLDLDLTAATSCHNHPLPRNADANVPKSASQSYVDLVTPSVDTTSTGTRICWRARSNEADP